MSRSDFPETNDCPGVLVRVDATKDVALGHLKRCISLAHKLRGLGVSVTFLTAEDNFTQELLCELGFDHAVLDGHVKSEDDYSRTLETASHIGAKIVMIDSYAINDVYRKKLMESGFFVVSLDDIADRVIPSHIIFNGNLGAECLDYRYAAGGAKCFLGIKYLILGPEFWNPGEVTDVSDLQNVLITMGGIDHYDLTSKILAALDGADDEFEITVIVGPYYDNVDSIQREAGRMQKKVNLVHSPPSLYSFMKRCSIAFSAGGQTLYELAALGRPTIGITLWPNQAGNVEALSKSGAILGIVYSEDESFDDRLKEAAFRLIHHASQRTRLSETVKGLVDGRGAERTCQAILDSHKTRIHYN